MNNRGFRVEILKIIEREDDIEGLNEFERVNEPPLGMESLVHSFRVDFEKKKVAFAWSADINSIFDELRSVAKNKKMIAKVTPIYLRRLDFPGGAQCYLKPQIELLYAGSIRERLDTISHCTRFIEKNQAGSTDVFREALKSFDLGVAFYETKKIIKGLRKKDKIKINNPITYFGFEKADWCAETNPTVVLGGNSQSIKMASISCLDLRDNGGNKDIEKGIFKYYYCHAGQADVSIGGERILKNIYHKRTKPKKFVIAKEDCKVLVERGRYIDVTRGTVLFEHGLTIQPIGLEEWEHHFTPLFSRNKEAVVSETVMLRKYGEKSCRKSVLVWARVPRLDDAVRRNGVKEFLLHFKDQLWINLDSALFIPIRELVATIKKGSKETNKL